MLLSTFLAQASDYDYSDIPTAAEAAAATTAAGTGLAIFGGLLIFWILFWLASVILFIIALIDVIRRNFANSNDKVLWIVLILLLPTLGPILYFIIGKKKGNLPA